MTQILVPGYSVLRGGVVQTPSHQREQPESQLDLLSTSSTNSTSTQVSETQHDRRTSFFAPDLFVKLLLLLVLVLGEVDKREVFS